MFKNIINSKLTKSNVIVLIYRGASGKLMDMKPRVEINLVFIIFQLHQRQHQRQQQVNCPLSNTLENDGSDYQWNNQLIK